MNNEHKGGCRSAPPSIPDHDSPKREFRSLRGATRALPLTYSPRALAVWQEPLFPSGTTAPLFSVTLHSVKGRVVFFLRKNLHPQALDCVPAFNAPSDALECPRNDFKGNGKGNTPSKRLSVLKCLRNGIMTLSDNKRHIFPFIARHISPFFITHFHELPSRIFTECALILNQGLRCALRGFYILASNALTFPPMVRASAFLLVTSLGQAP